MIIDRLALGNYINNYRSTIYVILYITYSNTILFSEFNVYKLNEWTNVYYVYIYIYIYIYIYVYIYKYVYKILYFLNMKKFVTTIQINSTIRRFGCRDQM